MLRGQPLKGNSPERGLEVPADVNFITCVSPGSHAWLRDLSKPLVQEVANCPAARVRIGAVFEGMKDIREFAPDLIAASAVDLLATPIRKTCNPGPRSVGTSIDRSFAIGSPGCQLRDVVWLLSLRTDPGIERGGGYPHAPPEPNAREFARGDQLKRLRAPNAQQASYFAAFKEPRSTVVCRRGEPIALIHRRGNRMRRRFPRTPSAAPRRSNS